MLALTGSKHACSSEDGDDEKASKKMKKAITRRSYQISEGAQPENRGQLVGPVYSAMPPGAQRRHSTVPDNTDNGGLPTPPSASDPPATPVSDLPLPPDDVAASSAGPAAPPDVSTVLLSSQLGSSGPHDPAAVVQDAPSLVPDAPRSTSPTAPCQDGPGNPSSANATPLSVGVNQELVYLAADLEPGAAGPVLAVLVQNGINSQEALTSVAGDLSLRSAIAEELTLRGRVVYSIMCNRALAEKEAKKETKELNADDMTRMLTDFQALHGSTPPPPLVTTKPSIIQKMKRPDQGVCMDLNEFLPRREAPSPLSPEDSRSFKLTSSGQLIASGGEKRKLSGFTELSVALFRWGVTYSVVHPPVIGGSPSDVGLSLCDVLAYWRRLVDFLPAIGAPAIIDYDAKYRSAIAQLVTTKTHSVSHMLCEDVLPTIMSAALARATVVSSRPSQQQITSPQSTPTNSSPPPTESPRDRLCRHFLRGESPLGTAVPVGAPANDVPYQDGSGVKAHLPSSVHTRSDIGPDKASFVRLLVHTVSEYNLEGIVKTCTASDGSIKPESVQSLVDSCSTAADSLLRSLEESRNVSPRPCTSSSTIRPEVLRFLSDIFDKGNDDDLASEVDSGVNLGFEGGLRRSGVFPAAKATKKPDGDADFFQEYSAGRLRPGNYFSAPDAVSAIKHLFMSESNRRFCCFSLDGHHYENLAVPFGVATAGDGHAASTSKQYDSIELFYKEVVSSAAVPFPASGHSLALFAYAMSRAGYKFATVSSYLSAMDEFILKMAKKSASKICVHDIDQKLPLTRDQVTQLGALDPLGGNIGRWSSECVYEYLVDASLAERPLPGSVVGRFCWTAADCVGQCAFRGVGCVVGWRCGAAASLLLGGGP
ncbi:hypothetical protein FOZ61_010268, partial [Perkinsus olseni]